MINLPEDTGWYRKSEGVDPMRWPHTSMMLDMLQKSQDAALKGHPAIAWAYSNIVDKAECRLMAQVGVPKDGEVACG